MIKTFDEHAVAAGRDLDGLLRAFETAQIRRQTVTIEEFLPDPSDPEYLVALCELVRLDMEFSWDRGKPRRLADYRERFPELFSSPEQLGEVAYEEYRLRLAHEERTTPQEYASRFGIDCSDWPAPGSEADPAHAVLTTRKEDVVSNNARKTQPEAEPAGPNESIRSAAIAYAVYRLIQDDSTAAGFDAWAKERIDDTPASVLFRDLHQSDPAAACRLAQGVAVMPEVGSRFLDFQLIEELGRGTFGRVYLARQDDLSGRLVALKISADLSIESGALAQLQHTHIVPIYSLHQSGSLQAVCMPYFGSTTLADLLKDLKSHETLPASGTHLISTLLVKNQKTKPARTTEDHSAVSSMVPGSVNTSSRQSVTTERSQELVSREILQRLSGMTYVQAVLWIAARVADALGHAHERGILHLDLKPANILLTDQGPMLLDFNLAADTKLHGRAAAAFLGGTLPYMAPEHLAAFRDTSGKVDARCDIYSFGVIIFELLNGRRPFATPSGPMQEVLDTMMQQRQFPVADGGTWNPSVTPAVRAIVGRCLNPDPALRYQNARQLQEDLERHLANLPLRNINEPSLRERMGKWYRRNTRTLVRLCAAVALAGIVGLTAFTIRAEKHASIESAQASYQGFKNWLAEWSNQHLINTSPDPAQTEVRIKNARQVLDKYKVLDGGDWRQSPLVTNLPADERAGLTDAVGGLLLLLAQMNMSSLRPAGSDAERSARLDSTELLLARAESCFDQAARPRVILEERVDLANLRGDREAAQRFREALRDKPFASNRDKYMYAVYLFGKRNFAGALPILKEETRNNPFNLNAWWHLGCVYLEQQNYTPAHECFSICIAMTRGDAAFYLKRALASRHLLDPAAALLDLNLVLVSQPASVAALLERAMCYTDLKRYPEALADLDLALRQPDAREVEAGIHFQRARVLGMAGKPAQAREEISRGLAAQPRTVGDWNARGMARLATDPTQALGDFEEMLKLDPTAYFGLYNKAVALGKLGRLEEAVASVGRALELYPEAIKARVARGIWLARLGKRDLALADAAECLKRDPQPATRYQVAAMYALTSKKNPADVLSAVANLAAALRRDYGLDLADTDKDLDPIRKTNEFQRVLESARTLRETSARADR